MIEILRFFSALNPCSKDAGLEVKANLLSTPVEVPIQDFTFYESLQDKMECFSKLKRGFWVDYIANTFHFMSLIGGAHHPLFDAHIVHRAVAVQANPTHPEESREIEVGSKGLLDFLIFPLLVRKLTADTHLASRKNTHLLNTLSWMIALPLEIIRDVTVIGLTALMAVTLVPLITIRQQWIAPAKDDLPTKNKGFQLDISKSELQSDLVSAWQNRQDKGAAEDLAQLNL